MRRVLAAVLCIALPIAMFASDKDNGYKVTYDGGSLPDTKSGTGVKIYIGTGSNGDGDVDRGPAMIAQDHFLAQVCPEVTP
jgi:hypothetical protein